MKVKLKYQVDYPYVENLIKARGIEDVESFLHPSEDNLQDPFDLTNMDVATTLVQRNLNKKTLVVVDSDADGYNSASMLIDYLQEVYPSWEFDYFVHQHKQHGLEDVVNEVALDEYEFVILPDAGTNDDEYIKEFPYIDFLILDHHLRTSEEQPPLNAVIVNNQTSPYYKNKSLCGAGVVWQFCRAMDVVLDTDAANKYIDQAAVAIIGDVMDITTPENMYIIKVGLDNIRNQFLRLLCDNASFQLGSKLTPTGIAFYVVPMINSMCRMGGYEEKKRMFQAFTWPYTQVECHKRGVAKGTMIDVSIESVRECTNAKAKQKREQTKMAELCEKQIIENDLTKNKIIVIVLDETFDNIPPELNGLAATQLSAKYNRPVYILRENSDGEMKGSGRGLATLDMPPLKDFVESSGLTEFVAGHALAHGAGILSKNLDKFIDWTNEQLAGVDMGGKTWMVDFELDAAAPNLETVICDMDSLQDFYGQGFPECLIAIDDIKIKRSDIQIMGKGSDTVKITKNGIAYMFFKRSLEEVKHLTSFPTATLDIVGTPNLNYYNGKTTPQIFVSDYTIRDNKLDF